MKTSSVILGILAVVIVVSLLAVRFTSSIQDFMAGNTMWNGIAGFTAKYQAANLDSLDNLPDQPGKSVLVSIPYLKYSPANMALIKQFLDRGNTLLLMDDFGYGNDILQYLGINARFNHSPLLDPLFCYKNEYLPRITDFAPPVKEKGIAAIVLNHATFIDNVDSSQSLAWSSETSYADLNLNGSQDPGERSGPYVVAAEIPLSAGVIDLVSDPSLIINTMAGQNDTEKFISFLTQRGSEPASVLLDRSHISKSPLDVSKITFEAVFRVLSNSYALLGLLAVIFTLVICYTLRKGELFG